MKKFSVADLARIIKASAVFSPPFHGGLHAIHNTQYAMREFTGVSIDSRTTKTGDCFFAIPGENFDGHDYVSDAFAKGAVCAVVRKDAVRKIENRNLSSSAAKESKIEITMVSL